MMVQGPLRGLPLAGLRSKRLRACGKYDLPPVVRQENDDVAVKCLADMLRHDGLQALRVPLAYQHYAQTIKRGGPLLLQPCGLCLLSDPQRQAARHECNDEHHEERNKISRFTDYERVIRRNEEKVEGRYGQERGEQGGPLACPACRDHDPQKVNHRHVNQLEIRSHQRRYGRAGSHARNAPQPFSRGPGAMPCVRSRMKPAFNQLRVFRAVTPFFPLSRWYGHSRSTLPPALFRFPQGLFAAVTNSKILSPFGIKLLQK